MFQYQQRERLRLSPLGSSISSPLLSSVITSAESGAHKYVGHWAPGELLKASEPIGILPSRRMRKSDMSDCLAALLFLVPLIRKRHWRPVIRTPLPVQATEPRKDH